MDAKAKPAGYDSRFPLRRQLGCTATLLAALALLAPAPAGAAARVSGAGIVTSPSGTVVAAKTADSFVESIGVNTHTSYSDTVYGSRFDELKAKLAELGVRHVRESLQLERPDQYEHLNELAAIGIKSDLILGSPSGKSQELETLVSTLKTDLAGSVDAVEGPNEFDTNGGPDWAQRLTAYQQALYAAIKSDPALSALPVIGPSIVQRRNREALGNISTQLDYGNIHSYPNGDSPESNLSSQLSSAAANSGSKPIMATETGYQNALNGQSENEPISEEAMATYMPRVFLDYFGEGVARTYAYELVDEHPDPSRSESESEFGLLRNDLSEKPAFSALRNLIAILSDPGPTFVPSTLDYVVGGNTEDLHQVLLEKRDGSYYLALWRASSVWDSETRTAVAAPSSGVKLEFAQPVANAKLYVPNDSAAPVASLPARDGHRLGVEVGPQVSIVHLTMGKHEASSRIRLWLSSHSVPAGGHLDIHGRLPEQAAEQALGVKIQRWNRGWRTVGRSRTSRLGTFEKRIKVPMRLRARASRLRVVARRTRPSKTVRVQIR